jgi:hypothetical protein
MWDRDISDIINKRGQDNLFNIIPELRLKRKAPLTAEKQILREPCSILAKTFIE